MRGERKLLLALLVVAAASWAFVELADEVSEGGTHGADTALLLLFRAAGDPSDPLGPAWAESLARDVTALGAVGVLAFLTLAAAGFTALQGRRGLALYLLVSVGSGMLAASLLKLGFARPRPDLVPHGQAVYTSSFPSGHSMMSAVVYLTLGALLASAQPNGRLKAYLLSLALLLTILIGLSRIYLGVHWPTDVLAGWTAGAAWALACWTLAHRVRRPPPPVVLGTGVAASPSALMDERRRGGPDMAKKLVGKRIAFLAADGVEQVELVKPWQALKAAGADVELISTENGEIQGMNHMDKGDTFDVDAAVADADVSDYDGLVLPGGAMNPDKLRTDPDAIRFVRDFFAQSKPVAAICHAPWTLIEADVVRGRTLTSWPSLQTDVRNAGGTWVDEQVHVDRGLVTSRKPADLDAFCAKAIKEFSEGRHAGQAA
jgi:PfpI family intracellular protease